MEAFVKKVRLHILFNYPRFATTKHYFVNAKLVYYVCFRLDINVMIKQMLAVSKIFSGQN